MKFRLQSLLILLMFLFGGIGMTGCQGIIVIPSEEMYVDLDDPNYFPARDAARATLRDMYLNNETHHQQYAVRLPSGVSLSSYTNVLNRLPGKPVAVPDGKTELPLYQIVRMELRQEDGSVIGVKPTAKGERAVTMELRHDNVITNWSWRVDYRRTWDMPVERVLKRYDNVDYVPRH